MVLEVSHVWKKFCRNLKSSIGYGMKDVAASMIGMSFNNETLRKDEFWAVQDISFQLDKGDVLGICGLNGSGKTTLLRMISGIFPPDKGEIKVDGRIGALIAVGAGFHPHMTGRENIYLYGSLIGMTRREIVEKFDDIVDFSEVGDFLDAPLGTYSSGMRVRLGFAVASALSPDLLILDEVLAVGDRKFRSKCLKRVGQMQSECATLFVSHNLGQINRVCNKMLILDKGECDFIGGVDEGVANYLKHSEITANSYVKSSDEFSNVSLTQSDEKLTWSKSFSISLKFDSEVEINDCHLRMVFYDPSLHPIAEWNSQNHGFQYDVKPGENVIECTIPKVQFRDGEYLASVILNHKNRPTYLILLNEYVQIQIESGIWGGTIYQV